MEAIQVDLTGPSGSIRFGTQVKMLPNGNFVVTDPSYSGSALYAGAVCLYGPAGNLISMLTGSSAYDQIGNNGVTVLENGNYVVSSPSWNNGAVQDVGAVTWCSQETGLNGVISARNSLVGTQSGDFVGSVIDGATGYGPAVTALSNGNYVVQSGSWDHGTIANAGAVTWGNGSTGTAGPVSNANSLVGSTPGETVGYRGVTALANGNYVVNSPYSRNAMGVSTSALTWGNGGSGTTGTVSQNNSLMGNSDTDGIGYRQGVSGVVALSNGNYVVCSPNWNDGAVASAGAVTWGDGQGGTSGLVSPANSLVGTKLNDEVGYGGVSPLNNGNYVVLSPRWGIGGAATWCNGTTGTVGGVSASNSLVGRDSSDGVGTSVTALANGNYVVCSWNWRNDAGSPVGAVTWGNGQTGITGEVSAQNSLVGRYSIDWIGYGGVTALANGNYVVNSPSYNSSRGAVTWGDGSSGRVGTVSNANSLVGSSSNDSVGGNGVIALSNGNYVVCSANWNQAYGAATWCDGFAGSAGLISSMNSLVGSASNNRVGFRATALKNGNYVVRSPYWLKTGVGKGGAVTWGDGRGGLVGEITQDNSLLGLLLNDHVGLEEVRPTPDGNYIVDSSDFNYQAGAISLCDGKYGTEGLLNAANSIFGSTAGYGFRLVFDYDADRKQMIVGRPDDNRVSIFSYGIEGYSELELEESGAVIVRFNALPAQETIVSRSMDLRSWPTQWALRASATGVVFLRDDEAPSRSAFYRMERPSPGMAPTATHSSN